MSNLNQKYLELMKCLEDYIKDPEEFLKTKNTLSDLVSAYNEALNYNSEKDHRISMLEKEIDRIYKRLESIEDDIYLEVHEEEEEGIDQMHDHDFEFEIICPYCDHQFITDSTFEEASQIKCPKCNRIIELDWADLDYDDCDEPCNYCGHNCHHNKEEEQSTVAINEEENNYSVNIQEPEEDKKEKKEKKDNKNNKDNNDDDM